MAFSVESAVMLLERLSVVEEGVNKITHSLEKDDVFKKTKMCPCWISSIEYFESGCIKNIHFHSSAKFTCVNCNPAYIAFKEKQIRSFNS